MRVSAAANRLRFALSLRIEAEKSRSRTTSDLSGGVCALACGASPADQPNAPTTSTTAARATDLRRLSTELFPFDDVRLPDGGRPRPRASGLVGVGFGDLRRPPRLTRTMTRPAVSFRGMVRSRALRSTGRADGPSAADRFLLETDPTGPQPAPSRV